MNAEPIWIPLSVAFAVHDQQLAEHGGGAGVRDPGLLESALARSLQRWHYEPTASIHQLAAAYAAGILQNHPFVDGNKRTAFVLAAVFLERNGYRLSAEPAEAAAVFLRAAAGALAEDALSEWLKLRTEQI